MNLHLKLCQECIYNRNAHLQNAIIANIFNHSLFNGIKKSHFFSSVPHGSPFSAGSSFVGPPVVERRRCRENGEAAVVHEEIFVRIFVLSCLSSASKALQAQVEVRAFGAFYSETRYVFLSTKIRLLKTLNVSDSKPKLKCKRILKITQVLGISLVHHTWQ